MDPDDATLDNLDEVEKAYFDGTLDVDDVWDQDVRDALGLDDYTGGDDDIDDSSFDCD